MWHRRASTTQGLKSSLRPLNLIGHVCYSIWCVGTMSKCRPVQITPAVFLSRTISTYFFFYRLFSHAIQPPPSQASTYPWIPSGLKRMPTIGCNPRLNTKGMTPPPVLRAARSCGNLWTPPARRRTFCSSFPTRRAVLPSRSRACTVRCKQATNAKRRYGDMITSANKFSERVGSEGE